MIVQYYDKLPRAIHFAIDAHSGAFRWDNKTPYITHPKAVANIVCRGMHIKYTGYLGALAYLHDVVEDTDCTLERIEALFGISMRWSVDAITKRPGEEYADYLKRCKRDKAARLVKIADLKHNSSDLDKKKNRQRFEKYQTAILYLEA